MTPIKIKYTVKRENGHIFSEIFTLKQIEYGDAARFLELNYAREIDIFKDQYTGKHDSERNELFQNDILQSLHFESKGVKHYLYHQIIWSKKYDGWFAKNVLNDNLESNGHIQLWVYFNNAKEIKLYSNIHENKELLNDN